MEKKYFMGIDIGTNESKGVSDHTDRIRVPWFGKSKARIF